MRLLTIHKAKGLEYPVVILAGGGLAANGGGGEPVVDRRHRRMALKVKAELPGSAAQDLRPAAYVALDEIEKRMAGSESRRLLYVALTRARDLLVVSCFGKLTTAKNEPANVLLGPLAPVLPAPGSVTADEVRGDLLLLAPTEPAPSVPAQTADVDALLAARATWAHEREALLREAARAAAATSPSGLERVDEEARADGAGVPPGRARALTLGSVVHRVMELCDLRDESSVPGVAELAARELGWPDLAEQAAELAARCWRSPVVREAAASSEVYRELPVGVAVEGVIVAGAVDLLFESADGAWVVVDYKTDRAAEPHVLRERYEPQGAAYALAVEAATGGTVREVVFVAAAVDGLVVTVPVDDALRKQAVADVLRATREADPLPSRAITGGR